MKVRTGLYVRAYVVNETVMVEYDIERNEGEFENHKIGEWIVTERINGDATMWEEDFLTKRDALLAIDEVLENGSYQKVKGLGWCYIPNEKQEII